MTVENKQPHLFLGVPLSNHVAQCIHEWSQNLSNYLNYNYWTAQEDYHITLKFLGATSSEQLDIIQENVRETARQYQPFELELQSIGGFGQPDRPRVLWAGVEPNHDLERLAIDVQKACVPADFPVDKRSFRPHITIAKKYRGHKKVDLNALARKQTECPAVKKTWEVDRFNIYRVNPRETPRYQIVSTFWLGG